MKTFREYLAEAQNKEKTTITEAKYGEVVNFDFKLLDKIYTAFKSIETEKDALEFIKKFSFDKYNAFKDEKYQFDKTNDYLTHKYFDIVRMESQFYLSAMNQNTGHRFEITLFPSGKAK